MSAWHSIGGAAWLFGSAMFGKIEEEARAALEANTKLAQTMFPTVEQAEAIEGYRQVGPC